MKKLKKPLSLILAFTMLVTTFLFANVFTVANAEEPKGPHIYGMQGASANTGVIRTIGGNANEDFTFSYPTDIYMNVGEKLEDVGYVINYEAGWAYDKASTDYNAEVSANIWGGTQDKQTTINKVMINSFANYDFTAEPLQYCVPEGQNDSGYNVLDGAKSYSTTHVKETAGKMAVKVKLKGTTNKTVGDYTFTTDKEKKLTTTWWYDSDFFTKGWKEQVSAKTFKNDEVLTMNVHIYNKAELNDAINDAKALKEVDYVSNENWTDFQAVLADVETNILQKREVTQDQVNEALTTLQNAVNKLEKLVATTVNYAGNGAVYYDNASIENGVSISTSKDADITLKAVANEGSKFAYWKDGGNRIISNKAEITVKALYSTTYTAVFEDIAPETTYTVTFLGLNGAVIDVQTVAQGESATPPTEPHYVGYTFDGWVGDCTNVTSNTVVKATYSVKEKGYAVTKLNDEIKITGNSLSDGNYSYNTKVVFTLDDYSDFAGWSMDGENVISYDSAYVLYVGANVNITYLTKAENPNPVAKPIVAITDVTVEADTDPLKAFVAILVERSAPSPEYTLVSAGTIFSKTDKVLTLESANANADVYVRTTTSTQNDGQYRLTVKVNKADKLSYCGFAVYKDKDGNLVTIYTETGSVIAGERI